jgi:hypothetical protein
MGRNHAADGAWLAHGPGLMTPNDYLRGFSPLKSPGAFGGLNPEFSSRLAGMLAQAPDYVRTPSLLESLYRSPEDQARAIKSVADRNGIPFHLGLMRSGIPGMAAPVGSSRHQSGAAADFNFATTDPRTKQWAYDNAAKYGIKFPLPGSDSGHAELDPGFYGPVRPFDLDGGTPEPAAPPSPVAPRSAPSLPVPGSPPMAEQKKDWLGLLSERFESPLFMMGANIFNQAYQPGGNIGAGLMDGVKMSSAMQRQKLQEQRERQTFEQQQAAGPLLAQSFASGKPDIGALLANPATREIALDLYKQQQQQNDPLRKAQTDYYGAQAAAKKAEVDARMRQQEADRSYFSGQPAAPMPAAPPVPVPTEGSGRFANTTMGGYASPPAAPGSFDSLPPQVRAAALAQLRAGNREEAYKIVSEGFLKPSTLASNLSVAEKAVDKEFAKTYGELVVEGGAADVKKNLNALRAVAKDLPKSDRLTGPIVGRIPDVAAAFVNPQSVAARENVEEVVQRNLRVILGAQFTNEEGKRLIARAYNPNLDEKENAKRLNRLIVAMEGMLDAKMQAADYYEKHGTLKGFRGAAQFSIGDLEAAIDTPEQRSDKTTANAPAPKGGARVIGVR